MTDNRIEIMQGDITKLSVDAICNAANRSLLGGGGVDGAIHRAAGPELLAECRTLNGCETGEAKITKGYRLPAKYVIHTVGPVYSGRHIEESQSDSFMQDLQANPARPLSGNRTDAELLRNCYINSLNLTKDNDIHSIAFPAISTGVYGYPKREAAEIAVKTAKAWLEDNAGYDIKICFVSFDSETYGIYQDICGLN